MALRYTNSELEKMLSEFKSKTLLEDLANKLNRSEYGIALKMIELSQKNPSTWKSEEVKRYVKKRD